MGTQVISPIHSIKGSISLPGDKSISHRGIFLASLAKGSSYLHHLGTGQDCFSTLKAFAQMGISFETKGDSLLVSKKKKEGLRPPSSTLHLENSGTSLRLLSGLLATQPFSSILDGDASLRTRPMERILSPLRQMGGRFSYLEQQGTAPIQIHPASLIGISYTLPLPSAQLKSALLLAGLFSHGDTTLYEPLPSRDHTERLLPFFGGNLEKTPAKDGGWKLHLSPSSLSGTELFIPGDISSASFFLAAALLLPNSCLQIHQVGLNPTRTGFLYALKKMGAHIKILDYQEGQGEPYGTLWITSSPLHGTSLSKEEIPFLIDELPILAVVASLSEGITKIEGIGELRFKESDRVFAITENITAMGGNVWVEEDVLWIKGVSKLKGGVTLSSFGDHRIAMAFSIAALVAAEETRIKNPECVQISYPDFYSTLSSLAH